MIKKENQFIKDSSISMIKWILKIEIEIIEKCDIYDILFNIMLYY